MFTTLGLITTTGGDGKHLLGSLFGKGSIIMICAIIGIAVVAVVVVNLQKKKNGNKGDKEDE